MYRLRHVILNLSPGDAEKAFSAASLPAPDGVMHGDVIHVYAGPPRGALIGEFLAGTPLARGGRVELPVLWPRRYLDPLPLESPGEEALYEAEWDVLDALNGRRCESTPRAAAVIYGVEECIFCRTSKALLRDAFGARCVHFCDVTREECFDRYAGLLEELFPGKEGVPLTLGRYGDRYWAAYGGLNSYDLERIYRFLAGTAGGLVAYMGGRARVYPSPANTLSNSLENAL